MAARWDCSSTCDIELSFSNRHQWRHQCSFNNGEQQWHRITYRYMSYPKNRMPSRVSIHMQGKDLRFWAGNYGTKFAQIRLRLLLREEHRETDEALDETLIAPEQSS